MKKPLCYSIVFFALTLACLCWGLVVKGYAANYYISNTGSDSNNGTRTSSPWQTIDHVNAQTFSPGDSILFKRGGIWRKQLNVSSSGTSSKPITFGAYGNGVAPTITGASITVRGRYLTIENFTVTKSSASGALFLTGGSDFCTIRNCTVTNNTGRGIYIQNSKKCVVESCETSYNLDGIFFYLTTSTPGVSTNNEVKNCYCHDNVKNGILFYSEPYGSTMRQTKVSIHDNECSNNSCGIYVHFLDDSSIYKNHTHHNTRTTGETYGIGVSSCNNCLFYLNEINDNSGDALLYYGDNTVRYGICNGNKFYRNNFYNNTGREVFGAGVPVANAANNNEVYYNIFHNNNTQYTIVFDNSVSGCKFYNNTIYGCSGNTILFGASNPGWEIRNNIFALNQGYAIYGSGGNLSHSNNCFYKAGDLVYFGDTAYNSSNIQIFEAKAVKTDPLMVSPASGDFQLRPGSPCIDAGVNVGLTQDYTGRSILGLPDIGAYEYHSRDNSG